MSKHQVIGTIRIAMPDEHHSATIANLVEKYEEAVQRGHKVVAERLISDARALDPATLEIELARRAFNDESGSTEELYERRRKIIERLGGVAVAAPDHVDAWILLSTCLASLNQFEGVLRATASGLKRDSNILALWLHRVRAQIQLGQMDSAARSLRHCTRLAPTDRMVEELVRTHPACPSCDSLFISPKAVACSVCGAKGPGAGGAVASVRTRGDSKFDIYFPRIRDVIAVALRMPPRIKTMVTLDTLMKRHLKRTNEQCGIVLDALSRELGEAFDATLFKAATEGHLDLLVADLIRAIDPAKDAKRPTGA